MRAPLEIKPHDDAETLRQEIRHAKDGRYQLRLRAILMRKEGAKSIQIQRELKIGPQGHFRDTSGFLDDDRSFWYEGKSKRGTFFH